MEAIVLLEVLRDRAKVQAVFARIEFEDVQDSEISNST
jgi:hypothetical protein